jgi:hypothetical protein
MVRLWVPSVVCFAFFGCGAALTVLPTTLVNGVVGTFYSQTLSADGQGPLNWRVTSGALPPGLDIDGATGAIEGVPAAAGTFTFTVEVNDNALFPAAGAQSYTITIIAKLTLDATLETSRVNESYSDTFTVAGGVPPYSYNVIGLPAGITFDPTTGAVFGTPLNAQTVQLQVTVVDSGSPQQSVTATSFLLVKPPPVSITTTALADGEVNEPYAQQLTLTNGTTPYMWQIGPEVGTLPAGLRLNQATGTIDGTPTVAGTSEFTVTVTDSDSPPTTDSKRFIIIIQP